MSPRPQKTGRKTLHIVMATRPNFMKAAPLYHALAKEEGLAPRLVHTGQHYDENMSGVFLRQLKLPEPDVCLNVGSGSHAAQTAAVMVAYEDLCQNQRPDMTIVIGDVNSTLAAALAAAKLGIAVAHLEAGLRSFDRSMPEEINRVATDALADFFWTPSQDADDNLLREGKPAPSIRRVGNIMMDSFELLRPEIAAAAAGLRSVAGLAPSSGPYGVVTLHRPGNVDARENLEPLLRQMAKASQRLPLIWPLHPRTRARLEAFGLWAQAQSFPHIRFCDPMGYVEFMALVQGAACVITDSGGIQEETTYLGIPCLTLRPNTERPVTVTQGTNRLAAVETLPALMEEIISGQFTRKGPPDLWDGKTAGRIVSHLHEIFS